MENPPSRVGWFRGRLTHPPEGERRGLAMDESFATKRPADCVPPAPSNPPPGRVRARPPRRRPSNRRAAALQARAAGGRATGSRGGGHPDRIGATARRHPPGGEYGGLSPARGEREEVGTGRVAGRSALKRTEGSGPPCEPPAAGARPEAGSRSIAKRPSDRRGPGRNPGPQSAFEVSMINVSCNSH